MALNGSRRSSTQLSIRSPYWRPVLLMNCHIPTARARDTALLAYPLSISARYTRSSGSPYPRSTLRIMPSYRAMPPSHRVKLARARPRYIFKYRWTRWLVAYDSMFKS